MNYLQAALGVGCFVGIGYFFSTNRSAINWRIVGAGLLIQIVIALLIGQVPFIQDLFTGLSRGFVTFLSFSLKGAEFLYGDLARNSANEGVEHKLGYLFVFQALPTVIFFSSVTAGLYYLGVLQRLVKVFAWVMTKAMRLSGAESLSAAGNIFLGQTEAPMMVRPFMDKMTRSELHCLMTGGMATIAGSVLGAYVSFLGGGDPEEQTRFATYLLGASLMNAPAAIVMAKLFVPEQHPELIDRSLRVSKDQVGVNFLDALARGAADGVKLAINIAAMLLAFIGIIYALNWFFVDGLGNWMGWNVWVEQRTDGAFQGISMEFLLGQLFRPFAFMMGVEWSETLHVGSLLGQRTIINEFVAYASLAEYKTSGLLSDKAVIISTYALCGFANFSSIAIQIGGLGGLAPGRQSDVSSLGIRALAAATLATMVTATIVGVLLV